MKILIQRNGEKPRELTEGYADEKQLQEFLRDYADLIPVEEIELGTPPLLCIGWEVHAASGSEDLLYVDETGLLTVVETKLRKNPEARRAVVGQVLEYAADTYEWTTEDVISRAQRFLSSQDCPTEYGRFTFEEALKHFLEKTGSPAQEDFEYSEFLDKIKGNLERGHIRLIIAIDEPPPSLVRTVEFVNRFSERFEMYLIQLKRFHDATTEQNIFVPALFGGVGERGAGGRPRRQWDRESFLNQAHEKSSERVPVLEQLIRFAESQQALDWGSGGAIGTLHFLLARGRPRLTAFTAAADGEMYIDFSALKKRVEQKLVDTYRQDLSQTDIPHEAINTDNWKHFDAVALSSQESWNAFEQAVLALKRSIEAQR